MQKNRPYLRRSFVINYMSCIREYSHNLDLHDLNYNPSIATWNYLAQEMNRRVSGPGTLINHPHLGFA